MSFQYNDGGRAAAGYKGESRDCVCRRGKPTVPSSETQNRWAQFQQILDRRKANMSHSKFFTSNFIPPILFLVGFAIGQISQIYKQPSSYDLGFGDYGISYDLGYGDYPPSGGQLPFKHNP